MESKFDFDKWFDDLDFTKNVVTRFFKQVELDADFCDHSDGIFGFWKDHRGATFFIKPDPCYFGYYTIFVHGEKTRFDGTPYFSISPTSEQIASVENGLAILSDAWRSMKKLYETATDVYGRLREATFETCHTCDDMDDRSSDTSEMEEACQKWGNHAGCFTMKWRQSLSDAKKVLIHDEPKHRHAKFHVEKVSDVKNKIAIATTTVYETDSLDDAFNWITTDCDRTKSMKDYPIVNVDKEGRTVVLTYLVADTRLNTVWKIVEFP